MRTRCIFILFLGIGCFCFFRRRYLLCLILHRRQIWKHGFISLLYSRRKTIGTGTSEMTCGIKVTACVSILPKKAITASPFPACFPRLCG